MALDLRPERFGSKAKENETYVSGAEILSRINGGSGGYLSGAEIMARANAAEPVRQANKFLVDRDKFYRAVDMDTSGENQFNAADYFEERKKQAQELKDRADAMSLYMNDHADSFSKESYERMMNILSTFDTDVDDVMSRYQPSVDAKTGMRAYEDELIAAMERNEQLNKLEGMAAYSLDPGDYWGNLMRQGRNTEGDRGVNDNWSAEQRYRLGLMQMEDPNEAKKYAAQVNAGEDPYVLYQQQEQQKADWRAMDLNAEKREIDRLKAELDDYYWNSDYDATATNARNAFDQEVKRREKEISDREQQYNLAKQEQESAQFRSAADQSDYAARSGYVSTGFEMPAYVEDADPDEMVYEYINNPDVRSQINQQTTDLAAKGYDLLGEDEIGIYNYYYATEGPEKAQQYLDNIQDTLNQRIGERGAAAKQGDIWKQLMAGAIAGYSNAVTAPQYFFDKDSDYINTNPSQYMSQYIREDLADTGPVLPGVPGGASLGQMAYDLVNTTANMAPSILLSTAANVVLPGSGAFVGAVTMGSSAAGGAYQQALNAGYSKEQARNYAALSGASEVGLEYLLGGISKLGGEIPQNVLRNIVGSVDNAIAKAAITMGGSMASEGFEEGLQEVITPWIENLTLYADKDVNWDDVAYSTLLGALSGGVMEGPSVAVNASRVSKVDKQLQNLDAKGNTLELAELIVKHRSGEQLSEEDLIKLVKSEPAMQILEGMRSADPSEPAIANMTAEQVEGLKPTTSKDGNARQISRNESINVVDFAEVKDGKVKVRTDDGTVDYQDVSFGTEKQGNQYFAVESLPSIDTEHANTLLRTIQNADVGKDTAEVVAIRESYRLGYMGASTRDLRGSDAKILPVKVQDQIYSIGKEQRTANAAVRATAKAVQTKATGKYKKVVIEGKLSKLDGKRKAEIAYVDRIADTFAGTAVHVYESYEKNGKMYYRDNSGAERLAPNGKYVNGEIWVDLNSGDKGEGMMLNTFAHEMYHHIEEWNKPKAQELAEFVVKELGLESADTAVQKQIEKARAAGYGEKFFTEKKGMTQEQAANEVYMRAMSDFVADSLETMFTRGDPAKAIADLKKENKGLFDQIKAFIDEWVSKLKKFYSDKTISQEGAAVAQLEKFEQLQRMFMEAMAGAGENYNAALESITPGEAGIMVNENGDPVAMSTEDGSVMLSIRTYEEDGREAFRDYLTKCVSSNRLTETEMQEMIDGIEEVYQVCKEFKDKYAPFSAWSDAEVIRDTRGRPVFSVVTPNGDYKMNLDFSLVCKKRRTLDAVFNEMSRRGIIDDFELGQKSVVKINEIIRKHGLETACALCFVDAKRFRQASMADSFTRLYNELVESLVPEAQKGSIDHFNFSGYDTIKKVDGGVDTWDNSKLDFSHLDKVMKEYGKGTVEHKAARYIKNNPQGRKLLLRGDFMSSQGFDAVKTQNRDILKLYNSKKGTGGPKAAFGDVQYLNEIIKKSRTWTPAKAYAVGGVRIQSFSDYVPRMVFDYTQMIYDLAATKLPAHAYTKESLFVKQFGLTGVKINMSLIPAVAEGGIAAGLDAKGNYVWAGESFNYDEAVEIQNAEGYTENCGTICVGVSKQHIEKLLRDPNIRMVIPYHKSGLNPIVAHMNRIAEFTDYTNDQRTKDQNGKGLSKDFDFNKALHDLGDKADPKAVAKQYLQWCEDNGYTPKFAEFAGEENYYKLLEDFTLYDKDGKYVPQREVRAVFPKEDNAFGTMKDLIGTGLQEDAIVEGKRDKNLSSIVDEIQRTLPKTEAEISEEQVTQADRDLEAQYSLRDVKIPTRKELEAKQPIKVIDISVAQTTGRFSDRRKEIRKRAKSVISKPYLNKDTNTLIFLTDHSYTHAFNNSGEIQLNAAEHLPELIENAVLTHAEKPTHGSEYTNGVYTFFAAAKADRILPVKLKVKEYDYVGQMLPKNIRDYFENKPGEYAASYDTVVLEVEEIEESPSGSARDNIDNGVDPSPEELLTINVSEFLNLVNGEVKKYIPVADYEETEMNSLRNQQPTTRDILSAIDLSTRNKAEQHHLGNYQDYLRQLAEQEPRLAELNAQIKELYKDQNGNLKEISRLQSEQRKVNYEVNRLNRLVRGFERSDMGKRLVAEYKLKEQKRQARETRKDFKAEQKELIQTMQAEQRAIREELTGKISDITLMEREFIRLAKKYEQLDTRTGKSSIKDAKTIAQLKADLKAEAKSHKEDSKIWEREFNRLLSDYETAGRQIARLEATIARQRATAKARVEGRRKTEMRHKIQRKVNELDQLLRHGTKHRNVPEFLQSSVAAILDAINMEVRDGEQRRKTFEATIARYDRQIELAIDPLVKEALIEKRDNYVAKGDQFANRMATLKDAYQRIQDDQIPGMEIDEGLADLLDDLFEKVGDTPLGQMTMAQLDAVNDVLNITKTTITNANKMFAESQRQGVEDVSKSAMREVRAAGGGPKKKPGVQKAIEEFGWNNLKPVYVFEAIGSKTLTNLFGNLRKGEDTLAVDLQEGKSFFREQWAKHHGKDWDMEKKWTFTSTSGKRFELDLNQIMSLYALSKREAARDHLRVGGFSFDSQYEVKDEVKVGPVKVKATVTNTDASAYSLSDEILGEIISTLSADQRAFVDAMQGYLSDTMAAKGNEISMRKYGIRLFKEKNYFPLRVADQYMAKVREQQTGDRKLKNSGFTKEVTPHAKNPVVLSSFLDVWAEHVDEMSLYHSFVLPLDDMSRVLNYHDTFMEEEAAGSVVEAIRTAYGEGASRYIDQLIRDINGGARTDSVANTINTMMSKAKKAQTMASLSVAIQQPSAILRACAMIDSKYFFGRMVSEKTQGKIWEEIKEHAPIAVIKEMGGFDTNVGKSTVDYLTDTADYNGFGEKFQAFFKDENFRDDVFGRLPAFMDEVAWSAIWNAVKREQSDKYPTMDVKSDAFMKLVADRFTDVIVHTQVYDSVFSRSGMMRSKDTGVKMATAFMAEPTTTANMLASVLINLKRGGIKKKDAAKTVGAIVSSLALNSALVSLVYALRDDDEDKRLDEKYIENLFSNFFDSLNPLGYIPFLRDIQSMFQGYDVERSDMALFGDLMNAIQGLTDEDKSAWDKTEAVIGSLGNLVGVPLKNILRDARGIVNTAVIAMDADSKDRSTNTGYYMARKGLDLTDKDEMILAIQRGDEEHLQRVFGRFESQQKAESALQSAIRAKYLEDGLTAEETEELLTTYIDRDDEYEVYWLLDEWNYAKENDGSTDGYIKYGSLYEAIESGDYEAEINRFLEHGADASTIRSQITRKYRKEYLADETAREAIREKLLPVYEATGMYESDIEAKFNDWEFEAEYGMTYSSFKAEYREGNVTEAEMRSAMDAYGLLNYEIEEGIRDLNDDIAFENKYGMSLSEMRDAYDNGDLSRNQLIDALMFTGKTKTEATEEVNERELDNRFGIKYAKLDDAYKYNDISRSEFYNAMREHGATKQEADEAILGYDWLKKNVKKYPDLAISDAKRFVIKVSDKMEERTLTDYGVSVDAYLQYKEGAKDCPGVDADGDGHIDAYSKAKQLFAMIDQLPISDEAKDGLALVTNAESTLRKYAPWRK